MDEFRYVGSTPTELDGGRPIAPGEFTGPIDVNEDDSPHNAMLLAEKRLIRVPTEAELELARSAEAAAEALNSDGKDGESS